MTWPMAAKPKVTIRPRPRYVRVSGTLPRFEPLKLGWVKDADFRPDFAHLWERNVAFSPRQEVKEK